MVKKKKLIPDLSKLLQISQVKIAMDFGSFYARIILNQNLVYNQPTCFLQDIKTDSVLALGDQAFEIWGKESDQAQIIFPIKKGVIYNKVLFVDFLEAVLKNLRQEVGWSIFSKMKIKAALPASATNLDQKIFRQALSEVGLSGVDLIKRADAVKANLRSANWSQDSAGERVSKSSSDILLLDIGSQTTELGLAAAGQPTIARTLNFGGRFLTKGIQDYLRQQQDLAVSFHHASRLKQQLPNLFRDQLELKTSIRGIDVVNSLAVTRTIDVAELRPVIIKKLEVLMHQLKRNLSLMTSTRLVSALENGLYLTGGGSLLAGLDDYLSQKMQVTVIRSDQPFLDVVQGTANLI